MLKLATPVAFAVLLAAGAAQARPAAEGETYTATIRSGDLNLASPTGLKTFHGRVRAAANRVCGTAPVLPFSEAKAVEQCRTDLARAADRQVTLALADRGDRIVGTR